MANLKLPKLPDRAPVRHTIVVLPELEQKLRDYADLYRQSYGEAEAIEVLIPFILDAFLDADRAFLKSRKAKLVTVYRKDDKQKLIKNGTADMAFERTISEKK